MGRPIILEPWVEAAIDIMVRNEVGLMDAAMELGQEVTIEECKNIQRRASFNNLLWQTRHRHFADLSNDPNFTVNSVIGKLLQLAQKLEEEGAYDKSAEALLKLSKIKGWAGGDTQVSIFGELSQADLTKIRNTVAKGTPIERIQ
jgi:hypothetical protein